MADILVLLTDDQDSTLLVHCPDAESANHLASAAVFNDGGVSAWLVPTTSRPVTPEIIDGLQRGDNIASLLDSIPDLFDGSH